MALGQIMFKMASGQLHGMTGVPLPRLALAIAINPWFIGAILLYGALSVTWVWILAAVPLSTAYPFVALSFVITPLLGHLVFGDPFGLNQIAGLVLLLIGLFLIVS